MKNYTEYFKCNPYVGTSIGLISLYISLWIGWHEHSVVSIVFLVIGIIFLTLYYHKINNPLQAKNKYTFSHDDPFDK